MRRRVREPTVANCTGRMLDEIDHWGLRIAINTDAHAPGQLEWQPYGCDKAARAGIEPERIVNTYDADRLRDWTESHPTN